MTNVIEEPAAEEVAAGSIMERLRSQQKAQAARNTTTYPLAQYKDPQLVPKFRLLTADELKRAGENARREFDNDEDRILWGSIDTAIEACVGIYFRELGSSELTLIDPDGLGAMGFDERLAQFLGCPLGDARTVFVGVFGGDEHISEAFEYAAQLGRWMGNTTTRLDQAAGLGEA